MPTPEQVHEAVQRYAAAVSSADKQAIVDCFAEGASVTDPYPSPPHVGKDAIGAFWDQVFALGVPVEFLPEKTVVRADRAAFIFAVTVVSGETPATIVGFDILTVDDAGLISELVAYWDPAQIVVTAPPPA